MKNKEEFSSSGVDVSKWNGQIDWNKARSSGCEFVMIREGWGKKSPTQVDKM